MRAPVGPGKPLILRLPGGQVGGDFNLVKPGPAGHGVLIGQHMAMGAQDVNLVVEKFLRLGPVGRREEPGIGRDRAQLIMSGSAILQTILRIWPTRHIRVADRGLREGMLYSMMNADGVFEDKS